MKAIIALLALAIAGAFAMPQIASAQATRTWVSGVGDDANPCSRTAPCKTFAGAISKTAASGEINCLDPGGFGTLTITKSISILCAPVAGGVLSFGTNGMTVNIAATDKVVLDGLDIDGAGGGINGIRMVGSGILIVRKCSIKNHTQYGIDMQAAANATLLVEDCFITGNANGGVNIAGASGANNSALLSHSSLSLNGVLGVRLGPNSSLFLTGSTIVSFGQSIDQTSGGIVISYGNNTLYPAPSTPPAVVYPLR